MLKQPDVNDPNSRDSHFRRKRFARLETVLREIVAKKGRARILDIGGRREYWDLAPEDLQTQLSITLMNFDDELHPRPENEEPIDVEYVQGDGCDMPQYADKSYDLAHSNSVIEHVGGLRRMAAFADETRRVGDAVYLQTPNLWFPIEPHYGVPFLHWLTPATRARLMYRYKMGYGAKASTYREALATADHELIIDKTLLRNLFPDAEMHLERFALMTKSLIMVRQPQRS